MGCLTQKDIRNLNKIILKFEDEINFLTIEEVEHLQAQLKREAYCRELKDFKRHLDNLMPADDASEQKLDDFYSLEWRIEIAGEQIRLANSADIYQAVYDIIKEEWGTTYD